MESHRPTCYDIACHFYVSNINSATIPGTRLGKVLESMFHGRPLTSLSLKYLQELNLTPLHQLASGQISYQAFIEALDPELVARERAANAQHCSGQLIPDSMLSFSSAITGDIPPLNV